MSIPVALLKLTQLKQMHSVINTSSKVYQIFYKLPKVHHIHCFTSTCCIIMPYIVLMPIYTYIIIWNFLLVFSEGPLFPPEHELSLRAEGLEKPRRKRGRPPKQANVVQEEKVEEVVKSSVEEEENTLGDGRRRRKIRAPARYQGVVQVYSVTPV